MTPPERSGMRLRTPAELLFDRVERAFTLPVGECVNDADGKPARRLRAAASGG
jgi:hypothetical protein